MPVTNVKDINLEEFFGLLNSLLENVTIGSQTIVCVADEKAHTLEFQIPGVVNFHFVVEIIFRDRWYPNWDVMTLTQFKEEFDSIWKANPGPVGPTVASLGTESGKANDFTLFYKQGVYHGHNYGVHFFPGSSYSYENC